jgi:nitroimidazol reductase NimA-like FMN-containing flavoprotein (pyridoxamine 5'-phosphate oxidase superfamily)/ribosomal protein S18 acetylase RimI-like enzyme
MRREIFRMSEAEAMALLARAPVLHLASTTPDGTPVLRPLDGAVLDGAIVFHGAPVGEKVACVGRPAVVSGEELIAHLPSWFTHPTNACTASTLYRSAQAHGILERVDDRAEKARALAALMAKVQPEGGYAPVADLGRALEGVLVLRVRPAYVDGKAKLAQNRTPEERLCILEGLWRRGDPGDLAALEAVRGACPGTPVPEVLRTFGEVTFHAAPPTPGAEAEAAALAASEARWAGAPDGAVRRAHLASAAWLVAVGPAGRVVGTVRGVSDGRTALLDDLVVATEWRGRGNGGRLLALALAHPAIRGAREVRLLAPRATGLPERHGFGVAAPAAGVSELVLLRR